MPRAVHFDHEVARIFQHIGLRPDQGLACEPYDVVYAWRNAERKTLLNVNWSGVGPTGWHTSNFFIQPLLEPELDALVRAQPTVRVQRDWEAVTVEEAQDQVTVIAARPPTGRALGCAARSPPATSSVPTAPIAWSTPPSAARCTTWGSTLTG